MSRFLAILASLKATLIVASVAFARGDMLPVILISILLNLAQLGAKPAGHAEPPETVVVPRSLDDRR
jgi:Na+/H+-dicarboxylate symporter